MNLVGADEGEQFASFPTLRKPPEVPQIDGQGLKVARLVESLTRNRAERRELIDKIINNFMFRV